MFVDDAGIQVGVDRHLPARHAIKGEARSYRVSEFHLLSASEGGPFTEAAAPPADPRAVSLKAQLDALERAVRGEAHKLATPEEALDVQELVEAMLVGC